jgi:hypothetical protein
MDTRYPEIEVDLISRDWNALYLIGAVSSALSRAGISREEITEFQNQATSGDYDNVLATIMNWVAVK